MILIVDDQPENLFSLKQILELNHFETDTANSGDEALKKVLKNSYSLVILDVQMPGMDGFEVAEIMSEYSKTKDVSIIFLSAVNTDKNFIKKGYASGAVDYIIKPVDPDILLLKVKTFFRLYEQTQKLNCIQQALMKEVETRKEAEKKKDEFIGIASHELKTPLTSIMGYLQLLERSVDDHDSETRKKYVQRALAQLDKLHNLISELLDISKIESGELKLNKQTFSFDSLLNNTIEIIHQIHPRSKIVKSGDINIEVYGDAIRLEQVLINYFNNAFKYAPQSEEVHVITSVTAEGELNVQVKDFGLGIPKDKQKHVFQKFYQIEDSADRAPGLGLGLYICSEIIRRHHGNVGVESELNKGSTFYFSIPLKH